MHSNFAFGNSHSFTHETDECGIGFAEPRSDSVVISLATVLASHFYTAQLLFIIPLKNLI